MNYRCVDTIKTWKVTPAVYPCLREFGPDTRQGQTAGVTADD
jgi:hypothetical protein